MAVAKKTKPKPPVGMRSLVPRMYRDPKDMVDTEQQVDETSSTNPLGATFKSVQTTNIIAWTTPKDVIRKNMFPVIERAMCGFPDLAVVLASKNFDGYLAAAALNCVYNKCYGLRQQGWMFMKKTAAGKKKTSKETSKLDDIDLIRQYAEEYNLDFKSVVMATKRFPDDMHVELEEFQELLDLRAGDDSDFYDEEKVDE